MDHAATMRRLYALISAGDLDGSSDLMADFPSGQTLTSWPRRGGSERMTSCSERSSSANRIRNDWCDAKTSLLVPVRLSSGDTLL